MAAGEQAGGAQRTSGLAVASLVLSCIAFVFAGPICSVPGVICGHLARSECRRDARVGGGELALAGLVVGYINIALWVLGVVAVVLILGFVLLLGVAADRPAEPVRLQRPVYRGRPPAPGRRFRLPSSVGLRAAAADPCPCL